MVVDLGKLGDAIYLKEEEIEQANLVLSRLQGEKRELEDQLLQAMNDAGTAICRGKLATISISEVVRAKIEDWTKFEQYCYRQKKLYLMEKRISSVAYRELKESLGGRSVPGLADYVSHRLNVNKVNYNG